MEPRVAPARTRGIAAAATALALLLGMTACSTGADAAKTDKDPQGETVTVEQAQGEPVEVPVNPEKVFTFDLGVLDSLDALDVEVAGVPEAVYPEEVKEAAEAASVKIGSMKEPDFEKINAEQPDLIIISGRAADSYDELSKIAPTVNLALDNKDLYGSFKKQTETLGKIFDKEAEVADELKEIDEKIADGKEELKDAGSALVVMTSAGELTAYGTGSRFDFPFSLLGLKEAAPVKAEGPHGQSISFEFLAEHNPDTLLVVDRDSATGESGANAKATLDNDLVKNTNAAKNDKIVYLDSGQWYLVGLGLDSLPEMIDQVVEGAK
ncbi:siderophore ABC transporter substrate-binding protein [Micrococcoides hystricis]|uniref:Siderophore ABC transporter substrate-binding protein n=1 Tax=Micrococcoides hystricis TaxID=1572761 RepID=A0ABV6P9Y2_9MICC